MDKYERVELIGEGSFGTVYKYKCGDNFFAMKFMPKCQKESDLKALMNECEIQIRVKHDNIVLAYEYKELSNQIVLITEFIDGGNLSDLLGKNPKGLCEEKIQNLATDLMCALHYLHCNRVLHRDLKPQNVLIEKASGKAKLADFGFARKFGETTLVLTSIKGTPLYMAPELIEEKPYDFKADLWSAGAVLYEATFGKAPFATDHLLHLIKKVSYEKIFWPSKKDGRPKITKFLQGLLEKDPKKRIVWHDILHHNYFSSESKILECRKSESEFTMELTESQELAKEIQRQEKAKKLPGGSQTLINLAQKYEESRKNQKIAQDFAQKMNNGRRFSDLVPVPYQPTAAPPMSFQPTTQQTTPALVRPSPIRRRNSDLAFYAAMSANKIDEDKDTSFNNDEWNQFLDSELNNSDIDSDFSKVNANDLAVLVKPLQTSKSSTEVINKTVTALSKPFLQSDLIESTVCQAYKNANVIKHVQAAIINNIEISEHPENSDNDKKNECIKNMLVLLTRLCYSKNENYFAVNLDTELIVSLLSKKSEEIQKYSLDILIQIAIQNPNAAANLIKSESLLNCIESHTKKVILLMSMIPSKRKELQTWLKNNEIAADKDENLTKLCNKFLSAI